jgi:hypothetical protein
MEEKEGLTGLINEEDAMVEVETDGEEEVSLKDMITEIVKEVMATMKSEMKEEDMKMAEKEEDMKMAEKEEDKMKMAKDEEDMKMANEEDKMKMAKEEEDKMKMAKEEDKMKYESEIVSLKAKLQDYENKEKLALVEKFSMLDIAFIEDVKSNISSYSVDQLEAKLSIEAVRSGLVFSPKQENVSTFAINNIGKASAPSWIAALEKI